MTEFMKASEDVLAVRRALAEMVRDQLVRAGIPASFEDWKRVLGGAVVEVDEGDDQAGGVFVRWECPADLADQAADAVCDGQFDHPSIAHAGFVSKAMCDAMLVILHSAGINATVSDDDMRPFAVEVDSIAGSPSNAT